MKPPTKKGTTAKKQQVLRKLEQTEALTSKLITVQQFIELCRPYKGQRDGRKVLVEKRYVDNLKANIDAALNSITNPIVINAVTFEVIQGNHRRQCVIELASEGKIDLSSKIRVLLDTTRRSSTEISEMAIRANSGNASYNFKTQLIWGGSEVGNKLLKPIAESLIELGLTKSEYNTSHLTILFGALYNSDINKVVQLIKTDKNSFKASDIYKARSGPLNKPHKCFGVKPQLNLNDAEFKSAFKKAIGPGIELIHDLKGKNGSLEIWSEKFGEQKMIEYWILALSMNGKLSSNPNKGLTKKAFRKIVEKHGGAIKKAMKNATNDLDAAIDSVSQYFPMGI